MKTTRKPTSRMYEMATVVHRYHRAHGIAPTVLEIADELGISRSGADALVKGATDRGLIEMRPRSPRSIRVVGKLPRSAGA